MNLNEFASLVTAKEGGKHPLPIGQVKEVMRIVLFELANMPLTEALRLLSKYQDKQ